MTLARQHLESNENGNEGENGLLSKKEQRFGKEICSERRGMKTRPKYEMSHVGCPFCDRCQNYVGDSLRDKMGYIDCSFFAIKPKME